MIPFVGGGERLNDVVFSPFFSEWKGEKKTAV